MTVTLTPAKVANGAKYTEGAQLVKALQTNGGRRLEVVAPLNRAYRFDRREGLFPGDLETQGPHDSIRSPPQKTLLQP